MKKKFILNVTSICVTDWDEKEDDEEDSLQISGLLIKV